MVYHVSSAQTERRAPKLCQTLRISPHAHVLAHIHAKSGAPRLMRGLSIESAWITRSLGELWRRESGGRDWRAAGAHGATTHARTQKTHKKERQSRGQWCMRHALNNLLQRAAFNNADLDAICDALGGAAQRCVVAHRRTSQQNVCPLLDNPKSTPSKPTPQHKHPKTPHKQK